MLGGLFSAYTRALIKSRGSLCMYSEEHDFLDKVALNEKVMSDTSQQLLDDPFIKGAFGSGMQFDGYYVWLISSSALETGSCVLDWMILKKVATCTFYVLLAYKIIFASWKGDFETPSHDRPQRQIGCAAYMSPPLVQLTTARTVFQRS